MLSGFFLIFQDYVVNKPDDFPYPPAVAVVHQDNGWIFLGVHLQQQIRTSPADPEKAIIFLALVFVFLLQSVL